TPEAPHVLPILSSPAGSALVFMPGGFGVAPKFRKELYQDNERVQTLYSRINEKARELMGNPHFNLTSFAFDGKSEGLNPQEYAVSLELGTLAHQIALWETPQAKRPPPALAILGISQGSAAA